MWKNNEKKWGIIAQFLHWFVFAFLVGQITLGFIMGDFEGDQKWALFDLHKALGMSVILVIVFRLLWRFMSPLPKDPPMPQWQNESARIVIWVLYFLMIMIPVSGYLMSTLGGHPIKIFDLGVIEPLMKDPELSKIANKAHKYMVWGIIGFASLHILAAFYHHFILKDDVLKRMLPNKGKTKGMKNAE